MSAAEDCGGIERARQSGRGCSVFRPVEAAAFLGVHRVSVDEAMREWITSGGRRGLAHFLCGKGQMIRREAIEAWMQQREQAMIGA